MWNSIFFRSAIYHDKHLITKMAMDDDGSLLVYKPIRLTNKSWIVHIHPNAHMGHRNPNLAISRIWYDMECIFKGQCVFETTIFCWEKPWFLVKSNNQWTSPEFPCRFFYVHRRLTALSGNPSTGLEGLTWFWPKKNIYPLVMTNIANWKITIFYR